MDVLHLSFLFALLLTHLVLLLSLPFTFVSFSLHHHLPSDAFKRQGPARKQGTVVPQGPEHLPPLKTDLAADRVTSIALSKDTPTALGRLELGDYRMERQGHYGVGAKRDYGVEVEGDYGVEAEGDYAVEVEGDYGVEAKDTGVPGLRSDVAFVTEDAFQAYEKRSKTFNIREELFSSLLFDPEWLVVGDDATGHNSHGGIEEKDSMEHRPFVLREGIRYTAADDASCELSWGNCVYGGDKKTIADSPLSIGSFPALYQPSAIDVVHG